EEAATAMATAAVAEEPAAAVATATAVAAAAQEVMTAAMAAATAQEVMTTVAAIAARHFAADAAVPTIGNPVRGGRHGHHEDHTVHASKPSGILVSPRFQPPVLTR